VGGQGRFQSIQKSLPNGRTRGKGGGKTLKRGGRTTGLEKKKSVQTEPHVYHTRVFFAPKKKNWGGQLGTRGPQIFFCFVGRAAGIVAISFFFKKKNKPKRERETNTQRVRFTGGNKINKKIRYFFLLRPKALPIIFVVGRVW